MTAGPNHRDDDGVVAYLLKGYPRISELFIASEIRRLEQLGVPLRLYVLKRSEETTHHPVVDHIRAVPTYFPDTASLSGTGLARWLLRSLPTFRASLLHTALRHPRGLALAVAAATTQSVRAREGWRPRIIYVKELLEACELTSQLDAAGDVTHLHAHFAHGCTTVAWLASMITGIPFSFTGHAKDIYRESLNPAGLLARKMRAAAFSTTCTGANLTHMREVEPHARVHLAYHGLNAEFSALLADAPAAQPPTDIVRIISVGRLVPKKGFDVLVRAVADLSERDLDVELVIAGEDGSHAPVIRELAAELGVADRIVWRGILTQTELLAEYRTSSMFVLACRVGEDGDRDGIPNVLMEAMASGLPVVSTTVSGIPEIVSHDVNGLLVAPEDPHALADAIWRIAKDPQLAGSLGSRAAATIAENFDGDRLAAELAVLFARSRT
ncbi:MAG: glycosyltransferase family 4 protein [Acidimicrobiales bacterium]